MWQDRLKEILYILENSDVNEIDVTFFGIRYRVVKEAPGVEEGLPEATVTPKQTTDRSDIPEMSETATKEPDSPPGVEVLSPMPGTFYRAPSPDDPPFVKEGDSVKKGDPLCIIEAMKIMNEIEAEDNGVIQKIFIESGQAVEFNQPLFIIEPN
jgi:acetyl-CoA carboxylase biotin carboxyl carrier protein